MKNASLISMLWIFGMAGIAQVESPRSQPERSPVLARTLEDAIPHIELKAGSEGIGGATVPDAVIALQKFTVFPISIEEVELDKTKDGLTLGAAIAQLRALQTKRPLTPQDARRLTTYEKLTATEDPATFIVGFKETTFTLVQEKIKVRGFLDRVTKLDKAYVWKNYGTDKVPIIVIQPREKSALEWPVGRICGAPKELMSRKLYGPEGKITTLLQEHHIYQVQFKGDPLPDVQLDLCQDHLTARDVLNLTVKASRQNISWSLSGLAGLRWLTFQ